MSRSSQQIAIDALNYSIAFKALEDDFHCSDDSGRKLAIRDAMVSLCRLIEDSFVPIEILEFGLRKSGSGPRRLDPKHPRYWAL